MNRDFSPEELEEVLEKYASEGSDPSDIRHGRFREGSEKVPISEPLGIQPGALLYENRQKSLSRVIESDAAAIVAHALRRHLAWEGDAATWYQWTGNHWLPLVTAAPAETLIFQAVNIGTTGLGFRPSYATGIITIIQRLGLLPRPPRPVGMVPFTNGLLDVVSGKLLPPTPERALDYVLPHKFVPEAQCPNVSAWLLQAVDGDAATVELLRAWLAALIRGIHLQRFLALIGRGGSGKSTFVRLAVALVGETNSAITTLRDLEDSRFEAVKLLGKRLCQVNEAGRHGGALNVLKAVTGGDSLPIERKHVQAVGSFIFTGLVIMTSNEDLMSSDTTSGLERRRLVVRFSRTATQDERADWERRGGEGAVLHREIPGVVAWCLALSPDEIRRRFENLPERIELDNRAGLAAGNSVADWMLACTEFSPNGKVQIGVKTERREGGEVRFDNSAIWAYPSYLLYCQQHGRARPVSSRKFSQTVVDMAEHLGHSVIAKRDSKTRAYTLIGLRLLPSVTEPAYEDEPIEEVVF